MILMRVMMGRMSNDELLGITTGEEEVEDP